MPGEGLQPAARQISLPRIPEWRIHLRIGLYSCILGLRHRSDSHGLMASSRHVKGMELRSAEYCSSPPLQKQFCARLVNYLWVIPGTESSQTNNRFQASYRKFSIKFCYFENDCTRSGPGIKKAVCDEGIQALTGPDRLRPLRTPARHCPSIELRDFARPQSPRNGSGQQEAPPSNCGAKVNGNTFRYAVGVSHC